MGKTLDYDSVGRWMSLAVWASDAYREWKFDDKTTYTNSTYIEFFHLIAEEALNRAFSLRAGDRAWGVRKLLQAIAPNDAKLLDAFDRFDRESWLTAPGAKPTRKRS